MRTAIALLAVLAAPLPAAAQTSFSLSAQSDFRMRGLSYSDGGAVMQAAANHDFSSGLYAGAFLSGAQAPASRLDGIGALYLGMAGGDGQFHWDAGVVRNLYRGTRQYSYHEWYAGVATQRLSARLSWSPAYQGIGGRSVYMEVKASYPLGEAFEMSAHLGYLRGLDSRPSWYAAGFNRPDWRIGANAFSGDWSLQLAWSGTRRGAGTFPGWRTGKTRGLVLGATRHF